MPLRTGGRGGTNEIYLLTNYVQLNRHNVILYRVDADSAGTWEFSCTNANYVLSGVVLTGNHLYLAWHIASNRGGTGYGLAWFAHYKELCFLGS